MLQMLSEHVALGLPYDWPFAEVGDVPPHQNTVGHTLDAVQRALGHAKPTTTLTTYAHLWPTTEDRVRDAVARLVAEVVASDEGTVRAERAEPPLNAL